MRRDNFRWTNLPEAVPRGLCRDLDLGDGDPAKTLRSAFGARPTDALVQTAWPSLRDRWLAHHREARQLTVEELWQIGLGDGARPANREAEVAFLRSRNNARRLREVVLDVLISTGEVGDDERTADGGRTAAMAVTPPRPTPPATSTPPPLRRRLSRQIMGRRQTCRRAWRTLSGGCGGAAKALRGPVDPADFKTYVFPMLFWKWISDTWDWRHATAVEEFGEDVPAEVEADYHRFSLPAGTNWLHRGHVGPCDVMEIELVDNNNGGES